VDEDCRGCPPSVPRTMGDLSPFFGGSAYGSTAAPSAPTSPVDATPATPSDATFSDEDEAHRTDAAATRLPDPWPERRRQLFEARVLAELQVEGLEERMRRELRMEGGDAEVPREGDEGDEEEAGSEPGDRAWSDTSDFESERLHEVLEKRIRENAEGRYDFEIWVDPENR